MDKIHFVADITVVVGLIVCWLNLLKISKANSKLFEINVNYFARLAEKDYEVAKLKQKLEYYEKDKTND